MKDATMLTRACWQPWESLNIAADGKVYPCCVVDPRLQIGNLNEQSLEEIVAGDAVVGIKRKLLNGDIADLVCADCPNAPMLPIAVFKDSLAVRYVSKPLHHRAKLRFAEKHPSLAGLARRLKRALNVAQGV